MTVSARLVPIIFVFLAIITAGTSVVRSNADQAATMTEAAQAFLETLTPEQHAAAMFPFTSDDRFDWHFIPRERKGVPLKTMTAAQREAALAFATRLLRRVGLHL